MLNRRLWILFLAFLLGFLLLTFQLSRLQIADADLWHERMQQLIHHEDPIESYRGTIVDRHGNRLAWDVPSDELAIDYRAMNLDDTWLERAAIDQLKKTGEWKKLVSRRERNQRKEEIKADIAGQIDSMPPRMAQALAGFDPTSAADIEEEIRQRENDINRRVAALRQDAWFRRYVKGAANASGDATSSTGENAADVDDSNLDVQFQQLKLTDEVAAHTLRADLSPAAVLYFKQHLEEFPGLTVRDAAEYNRRDYPYGEATAHIVGNLRSTTPEALKANTFRLPNLLDANGAGNLAGYLPGDRMGAVGVEFAAEARLRGQRGVRMIDLSDSAAAGTQPEAQRIEPVPGGQVQLTIDADLQLDLYNALCDQAKSLQKKDLLKGEDDKDHCAAIVVMSIDGQILASISYPSYDPNKLDLLQSALQHDEARTPLLNRAFSGIYPPGSTAKPLLAVAGLNEKVITIDEIINCPGRLLPNRIDIFKCDAVHGDVSLVPAIEKSCDVYFYTVGQRLGLARLRDWYGAFGFGHDTGMELPENAGKLPPLSDDDELNDARRLGIGQGPIAVTPLQMANAYATLLRRGVAIPPRIFMDSPAPRTQAVPVSDSAFRSICQGMDLVVASGTGHDAFRGMKLRVAGKTGTAENPRRVFDDSGQPVEDTARPLFNPDKTPKLKPDGTPAFAQLVEKHDDAWFVGYAPADDPHFIVAAVMEWGGHGGAHAAPMVREALLQLEKHNYLPKADLPE